ncbi:MAG: NUDIX hydrolase [Betaproteobacteria bacterium]|jgi:8-oxo-dGTP pyrophosphatase MutT (NUDIX family)
MIWSPHITVATLVQRENRFLMVEERTVAGLQLNQPAGHLEPGESIPEAAVRETLEETGYSVAIDHLVGIYRWENSRTDITYLRFALEAHVVHHDRLRALDSDIVRTHWLSVDELRANVASHRSPLVMRCIEDFLAGHRHPLDLLHDLA